jgi:hypothetical protein
MASTSTSQNQRPTFYEGQFLGADQLTASVLYERLLAARQALGPHAWGIAVGLDLVQTALPSGAANVTLMPGIAWDGYGRCVCVTAPTQLPVSAFANYQSVTPSAGTLLQVWLRYTETTGNQPGQGFALCCQSNSDSVIEGWTFDVGNLPAGPQGTVSVAGVNIQPSQALQQFAGTEPVLSDSSVPFQQFPYADATAIWRIPVGMVRWCKTSATAAGFFGPLVNNLTPPDADQIRQFRQYIGTVSENILAPAGAIRLRDRGATSSIYQPPSTVAGAQNDLVWLEGSTRVLGDLRVCGGVIDIRDAQGSMEGTPEIIRRNAANLWGGQSLEVAFGPTLSGSAPNGNAFTVGLVQVPSTGPLGPLTASFTVRDNGYIGLGGNGVSSQVEVGGPLILDTASGGALTLTGGATVVWNDGQWTWLNANLDHTSINTGVAVSNALTCQSLNVGGVGMATGSTTPNPAIEGAAWIADSLVVGSDPTQLGSGTVLIQDSSTRKQGNLWVFASTGDLQFDGGVDGIFVFNNTGTASTTATAFLGANVGFNTLFPAATVDINGTLHVAGLTSLGGVSGNLAVQGNVSANGNISAGGNVAANGNVSASGNILADGNVTADGNISCGGIKFFVISHPLDPANKLLAHASIEGPEAAVFYRGEARLTDGATEVLLPSYFEALTLKTGRSVQLTPIYDGDEAISPLAASTVTSGRFKVRAITADNPRQRFYWEVKAVRADCSPVQAERPRAASSGTFPSQSTAPPTPAAPTQAAPTQATPTQAAPTSTASDTPSDDASSDADAASKRASPRRSSKASRK